MFKTLIAVALTALSLGAFAAVDANRASQAELETVKGIGPGLSAKIMEARKTGAFKSWTDFVERVSGVGPGNASRFSQAGLTVGDKAFDGAATVAKAAPKTARAAKTTAQ